MNQLSWQLERGADDGQAMVEYALILALVALVSFGGLVAFGTSLSALYQSIVDVWPS